MKISKKEPYRSTGSIRLSHEPEKPEPYFFNEWHYQNLVEVHQSSLRWLATICEDYKKLNFGIITKEILGTVMSRDLSEIQKRFYERVDLNLQRTGIDDEFILNNYRAGTSTPLTSFEDSVRYNLDQVDFGKKHFQHSGGYSPDAGNYTITQEGTLTFTNEDKERLKAGCMVFIDSDAKIKFSELTEAVIAGLVEIQVILDRNGLKYPIFGEVFSIDGLTGKVSIRKEFIKNIVK